MQQVVRLAINRGVGRIFERGVRVPMASAGARAYNGGLEAEPPASVQGAEPLVGVRGAWPPEADRFFENIRLQEPNGHTYVETALIQRRTSTLTTR